MDLIVCSTPYQIFTAVNMKYAGILDTQTDLIVFDYFNDADKIVSNINDKNIFANIRLSNTKPMLNKCLNKRYARYLWNTLYYLKCHSFVYKFGFDKKYDRLFYSFVDPSVVIMARYYLKSNQDLECIGFEDGLSDYYNAQSGEHYNIPRWARWFHIPEYVFHRNKIYLYKPELAPAANGKYCKETIPKNFSDSNIRDSINSIFEWDDEGKIDQKFIFFDQLPHQRVGATDEFNLSIVNAVRKYTKDIIVKLHPRRDYNIYKKLKIPCYEYSNIPFEVCCLNSQCNDKVFITNISSACFMPKIIFDYEPILIFLFKLEHKQNDTAIEEFIERFIGIYSDKTRVYFPESIEELDEILKHVCC